MSQYRHGTFKTPASGGVTLPLGFIPSRVNVMNLTVLEVNPPNDASPAIIFWVDGMPSPSASINTFTAGVPAQSYITTNGISTVTLGGDWQNTQYTITGVTKANPGVVTVTSATPTNTIALENGMTVTISGVAGMIQLNTNRYVVAGVSGATFQLYDLFGNPVNTTAFGTWTSGGIVNQISYPASAPVLGANGQVVTPGQPAGNQYDIGYQGVILGTGVIGDSGDLIWWEAFTETPTGY